MNEFSMVSADELNQIEGGGALQVHAGGFTAVQLKPPLPPLPPGGGIGATGDGGAAGGGGGQGFIWGDGDPKLPD